MNREAFVALVEQAVNDLPPFFHSKLENVEMVVEDMPTREQLIKTGLKPGMTLFGLYEGVPKPKRGSGYTLVLPDKITIFQRPIEYFFHTPAAIKEQVKKTVLHEIGHHFGLSDAEINRAMHE